MEKYAFSYSYDFSLLLMVVIFQYKKLVTDGFWASDAWQANTKFSMCFKNMQDVGQVLDPQVTVENIHGTNVYGFMHLILKRGYRVALCNF